MIADCLGGFAAPWEQEVDGPMTIDERLERLTERHEALTERVELLTRDVHELAHNAQIDAENIRALARIAEIH
jgi:archaellum component FlaC